MEAKFKKWRVSALAKQIGVNRDTLDKARRRGSTSTNPTSAAVSSRRTSNLLRQAR